MMIYTISNGNMKVSVNSFGAELWSIQGKNGTEYLWQGDPAIWPDRSPNLFPFVGRLTRKQYSLDGQLYEMGIHGFAAGQDYKLAEQTEDKLVFELTQNPETLAQYPRKFLFRMICLLEENTLHITYQVENRDGKTMYFGLGGHPGFRVPLEEGKAFTDYRLRFDTPAQAKRVGFTEACFLNGQYEDFQLQEGTVLPLQHSLFDEDAIVLKDMAHQVTLESDGQRAVTVTYPQMSYLGFWHWPKTQAPYVCIEPWATLPAKQDEVTVFEEALISLEPGKTYTNSWSITIR